MTDDVQAQAGVAAVAGTAPAGPLQFATELDESVPREFGVRFTSDYEPGGDYAPVPPPPAEVQHQMGLHQAGEG
jgi:hypothetical protein